jgi:hypothetical protein
MNGALFRYNLQNTVQLVTEWAHRARLHIPSPYARWKLLKFFRKKIKKKTNILKDIFTDVYKLDIAVLPSDSCLPHDKSLRAMPIEWYTDTQGYVVGVSFISPHLHIFYANFSRSIRYKSRFIVYDKHLCDESKNAFFDETSEQ